MPVQRMKKKVIGPCHICGLVRELSFERVPPRAAFNDRPVENPDITRLMGTSDLDAMERVRGRQSQRGAGGHTLCVKCNPTTGHWYGSAYVDWAVQGLELLHAAGSSPTLYHTFHVYPLRVIKQIITMFFVPTHQTFGMHTRAWSASS